MCSFAADTRLGAFGIDASIALLSAATVCIAAAVGCRGQRTSAPNLLPVREVSAFVFPSAASAKGTLSFLSSS